MTLGKIIDTLKMIALKHPNVNSAYEGNIYDILNSKPDNKYASVVITQQSHTTDETYDHYGFVIFYVDRLVDDLEENRVQIQSIGKSMLGNIITAFCNEFEAECDNIIYQPFTQRFTDETAGVYCTITIDIIKDAYCAERYWDESWSAPIVSIKNVDMSITIIENGHYVLEYDPTTHTGIGKVDIDVELNTEPYYNDGYANGYNNGVSEQKSKLEPINITENGTYTREDGYNSITVEVPDLNGSYDEGYKDGYDEGVEEGFANAETVIAEEAQELDITENGTYLTKYTDDIVIYPNQITGDFGDGNYFYNWGEIKDGCYNTEVSYEEGTVIELWWKYKDSKSNCYLFGNGYDATTDISLRCDSNSLYLRKGPNQFSIKIDETIWQHIKIETNGFVYLNGNKVEGIDLSTISYTADGSPFLINNCSRFSDSFANGLFGMVKINEHIFIPKDGGFVNYRTEEQLDGYVKPSNGTYEYVESDQITGYFDDGTPFYGSAELYNAVFYTDIIGAADSSFEVWWKDKNNSVNDYAAIIGVKQDSNSVLFKIVKRNTGLFRSEYGSDAFSGLDTYEFNYDMSNWTHIKLSKKDGLIVNGELLHSVGDKYSIINTPNNKFQINDVEDGRYANGVFGMVKINGQIFIPTEIGFMDYSNNTYLPTNIVISDEKPPFIGEYYFTENQITVIKGEGNFIKSVTVNVSPRINVQKEGLKFGYSSLTEIPEWADWEGITDMSNMFINCKQLKTIPLIDTSNVKTFFHTFNDSGVNEIALLNTSNGTNFEYCFCGSKIIELPQFDLRQGVNFYEFCYNCYDLKYVPNLDLSSATNINGLLENCNSLISVGEIKVPNVRGGVTYFFGGKNKNNLTDFGGLIGFRGSITSDGFHTCPNLSYQSCINILNGLYDFVGNGETPNSEQGQLKVHQNFLDTVGEEITIATNKGWIITA